MEFQAEFMPLLATECSSEVLGATEDFGIEIPAAEYLVPEGSQFAVGWD